MYICVTNIDAQTGVLCTEEPMRTGPAFPTVKGFRFVWANESIYPIDCDQTGRYVVAPLYFGVCDDDADISLVGVVNTLTEEQFTLQKRAEMLARIHADSWVFNETSLSWEPPIVYPDDGKTYLWDEATTSWVEIPTA